MKTRHAAAAVEDERLHEKLYYIAYLEASSNLWCWTLYNASDRMLARNVEKYYNKDDCLAAINVVKSSSAVPVTVR